MAVLSAPFQKKKKKGERSRQPSMGSGPSRVDKRRQARSTCTRHLTRGAVQLCDFLDFRLGSVFLFDSFVLELGSDVPLASLAI